ncbi:MAG: XdhC family protein [Alphaproteobacteria bacterium]
MTVDSEDVIDCMARMKGDAQPFALATVVRTKAATSAKVGAKAVIRADGSMVGWIGGGCTLGAVRKAAREALDDGRARMIRVRPDEDAGSGGEDTEEYRNACASGGTVEVFVEPILPRPALIVAGASGTARALRALAGNAGFTVTAAALADDLEGMTDADEKLAGFDLSQSPRAATSFIVVATQGKRDREALEAALSTGAPYVAFIGSRKKAAELKAQLAARGVEAERLAALRSPAGLDIGAVTPEEIALSVLAEIVRERRKAATAGLVEAPVAEAASEGVSTETRVVPAAASGCCGEGGKH